MLGSDLKKGSAEFLVLSLLEHERRHGYELNKLIESRSKGVLTFHIASLYPLLYRMEDRGWITGAGWRKPVSVVAASIRSPRPAGARSMKCGRDGSSSPPPSPKSRECDMDEWRERLRNVVAGWALSPEEQAAIVDELEQHLEQELDRATTAHWRRGGARTNHGAGRRSGASRRIGAAASSRRP